MINKPWFKYIVVLTALLLGYAIYSKIMINKKIKESMNNLDVQIESLNKRPPVATKPQPIMKELPGQRPKPNIPAVLPPEKKIGDIYKEVDDFYKRNRISFKPPLGAILYAKKSEGMDFMRGTNHKADYTFWISVHDNLDLKNGMDKFMDTFNIASDDIKKLTLDIKSDFTIVNAFEFESSGKSVIMVILYHPTIRKHMVVGMVSRQLSRAHMELATALFEKLRKN